MSRCKSVGMAAVLGLLLATGVWAQPAPGGGGDRGNRGGRGGDPAQFRQRFMDSIKERLGATDDEWKVLQPKLEKLMDVRREASSGFGGGMMFGGRRGGQDRQPDTAVGRASAELRQALENNAPAADIQRKLQALREAKDKAKEELTKAQKDLKELLTQKQEAQLVLMGFLE